MKEERKTTDLYEQLRQILDMHPSRAPASPHFDEILRILFTPEEIAVAVRMSFRPKKVEDIARAASLGADRAAASALARAARWGRWNGSTASSASWTITASASACARATVRKAPLR